jgi:hypothetical protein
VAVVAGDSVTSCVHKRKHFKLPIIDLLTRLIAHPRATRPTRITHNARAHHPLTHRFSPCPRTSFQREPTKAALTLRAGCHTLELRSWTTPFTRSCFHNRIRLLAVGARARVCMCACAGCRLQSSPTVTTGWPSGSSRRTSYYC